MTQFDSLMRSINRNVVEDRISRVYDTLAGAQGLPKSIKEFVKNLRRSVGLKDPEARGAQDFLRDFGKGI